MNANKTEKTENDYHQAVVVVVFLLIDA